MRGHNICFHCERRNIIFELSSLPLLSGALLFINGGKNIKVYPYILIPFEATVIILNIGTDRSEQTVQTQIRLLLMEQSDRGLLCLLFCLHLLNTILHCKIQLFQL